ncbi:MAG: 5-oxoprolinase subunit PxpA [Pseudomonadota bacterium]
MTRPCIDLNADLGEGEPHDAFLLGKVSSCNIACGGHIGDEASMTDTVRLAVRNGVRVGAHPAYPDREGFGRRSGFSKGESLKTSLRGQVEALAAVCAAERAPLSHLKPHGALYNDAAGDDDLATTLVELADHFDLALVGLPDSALERAATQHGVHYLCEGFVDRTYLADGRLRPRGQEGAVINDVLVAAEQALRLATRQAFATADGEFLQLTVDTLCLHGDTPNATDIASAVTDRLAEAQIAIASPS